MAVPIRLGGVVGTSRGVRARVDKLEVKIKGECFYDVCYERGRAFSKAALFLALLS